MSYACEEDKIEVLRAALRERMQTYARLDLQYRNEGWGVITDKAFAGRIRPLDIESQARDVARYAYYEIKRHIDAFNRQSQQLFGQDQEIARLNAELGKLRKELSNDKSTD